MSDPQGYHFPSAPSSMHLMRDIGGVQLPESVLRFVEEAQTAAEPSNGKVKVGAISGIDDAVAEEG
jgi:hypothetical protein